MKKLLLLSFILFIAVACQKQTEPVAQEGFVLPAVAGGQWDFKAQNQAKPVLVAFMATYCHYCKQMVSTIENIAAKYQDKGIEVVIILVEDDKDEAVTFTKEQGIKYAKVLYDGGDMGMTLGVRAFPQVFLFDDKTNSIGTWRGYSADYEGSITQQIDQLLSRPQEPSATMPRDNA